MSRASKSVYHPQGNSDNFTTVEAALDSLDDRVTQNESDISDNASAIDALTYDNIGGTWTLTDQISFVIEYPDNKDYLIGLDMKFAGTVVEITAKSSTGTCTLTPKINGTTITGGAVSVSSTEATSTATAANAFSAGNDLAVTVSSNSACENMAVTIKFTRVLP